MNVGIIGGTGAMGASLARRLAASGMSVVIGSRDEHRAKSAAVVVEQVVATHLPDGTAGSVVGASVHDAASTADIIVFSVPYLAIPSTCEQIGDAADSKTVISAVNYLQMQDGMVVPKLSEPSAAQSIANLLPACRVATGFNHISAVTLNGDAKISADVLIATDADEALADTSEVVHAIGGLRAVHVGSLRLAKAVEDFTAIIVNANGRNGWTASIKLVDGTTR